MSSALRLRKEGSRRHGKRTRGFMNVSRPDSILNPSVDTHVNMVSTLCLSNTLGYVHSHYQTRPLTLWLHCAYVQGQINSIESLYQSNAAVHAACTLLSGQLFSGGIVLRKDGKDVQLTDGFSNHLKRFWLPFARDVLSSFLKWGYVVIAYEDNEEDLPLSINKRQRQGHSMHAREVSSIKSNKSKKAVNTTNVNESLVVPIVPSLGSYDVSYTFSGRSG